MVQSFPYVYAPLNFKDADSRRVEIPFRGSTAIRLELFTTSPQDVWVIGCSAVCYSQERARR